MTNFIKDMPYIDHSKFTREEIMANQFLRLNSIYYIVDKDAKKIPFRMNAEQYDFYMNMHNLNIVTKARQKGFTTVIQLFLLDTALFTPNTSCGVIAHNQDDAKKFFDKKIKLAYDSIPEDIKREYIPDADRSSANTLKFSNGSYINVSTSMRSDTVQYLHVSEFGKLCAKWADKADEIVEGAFNSVGLGNWIAIESTGEGAHGHFYNMAKKAKELQEQGVNLSPMDYKLFFYPWWQSKEYQLDFPYNFTAEDNKYFAELEQAGIYLTRPQKTWYAKKFAEQAEGMWSQYPSVFEECFKGVILGAVFGRSISNLRMKGQITHVPWASNAPVNTFWDLGHNDKMAIWFHQRIGFQDRFIHYFEDNLQQLDYYVKYLKDLPFVYGEHYLPHDIEVTELTPTDNKTRKEVLQDLGIDPIIVVPRIRTEQEGIEMTRQVLGNCWFDVKQCAKGIQCLENVKYTFDERTETFRAPLLRNWAKHGGDALMQFGHGYRFRRRGDIQSDTANELARQSRAKQRNKQRNGNNKVHNTNWRT